MSEQLWVKWREHFMRNGLDPQSVCVDGIVDEDEEKYGNRRPRILFVLKDANYPDYKIDPRPSLLRYLRQPGLHPQDRTWPLIRIWAWGIQHRFPKVNLDGLKETDLQAALQSVAAINLKKECGRGSVRDATVREALERDHDLLIQQVNAISPHIAIVCGVKNYRPFCEMMGVRPTTIPYKNEPAIVQHPKLDSWFVGIRHPARADKQRTYDSLADVLKPVL